LKEKKYNKN